LSVGTAVAAAATGTAMGLIVKLAITLGVAAGPAIPSVEVMPVVVKVYMSGVVLAGINKFPPKTHVPPVILPLVTAIVGELTAGVLEKPQLSLFIVKPALAAIPLKSSVNAMFVSGVLSSLVKV